MTPTVTTPAPGCLSRVGRGVRLSGAAARRAVGRLVAIVGLAAVLPWPASAAPVDAADRRFMDSAAASGMVEIVLGRVAQEKSASEPVRQLGVRLVDDHNKANEELKAMAATKGVPLPTGLTTDQKALVGQLKKKKGAGFDQAYLARTVADHRQMVALFERASTAADDADVKAFAGRNLGTLRSHLDMAQKAGAGPTAAPARADTKLIVKPVTRE